MRFARKIIAGLLALSALTWGAPSFAGQASRLIQLFSINSVPAFQWNFATSAALPSGVTYGRASGASCVNASGALVTLASDAPCFDYNPTTLAALGLRDEASATNLALQSNGFATTWATNGQAISAATTSPDGTSDAWKIASTGAGSGSLLIYQSGITEADGSTHTFSIFFKQAEARYAYLAINDNVADVGLSIDAQTCSAGSTFATGAQTLASYSVAAWGNAWCRVTITKVAETGSTNLVPFFGPCDNDTTTNARPGFTSTGAGQGIYAFGAQVELGSIATSYIATTTAPVTRAAEIFSLAGAAVNAFANGRSLIDTTNLVGAQARTEYGPGAFSFATGFHYAGLAAYAPRVTIGQLSGKLSAGYGTPF